MYNFTPKIPGWISANASQKTVSSRTTFMEAALEKEKGEKRKTVLNTLNRLSAKGVHFIFLPSLY